VLGKLAQVRLLHLQNLALRTYQRTLRILGPVISEARARRGDLPVRVLELASGAGEMTMALAEEAARRGWPLEITGSDVVPSYVARANALAEARGSRARFRVIDAFALANHLTRGEVDAVFVAQSAHHFSAGQLAKVIAQVEAAGGTHVVIVDGHRCVRMLVALPTIALVGLDRHFAHDAWISARRFYSEPELELVARIAAPRATVTSRCERPLTTVFTVKFAEGS
jgi:SAM-dependent methyltransferase